MSFKSLQLKIAMVGILLPYVVRLPKGFEWLQQYTDNGFLGNMLLGVLNAIPWSLMAWASGAFRNRELALVPCVFGFGVLTWGHYTLDLTANANAPIGLVIIPLYAAVAVAVGTGVGLAVDRIVMRRND